MNKEFFEAIRAGDLETVKAMASTDHDLIEMDYQEGLSAILFAAYNGQPGIAEWLASQAITLSIFEAAAVGKVKEIVRIQARNPEMVSAYAPDGFQPLGLAAFFGHAAAVEFLIKAGTMVNAVSHNPLKVAPINSAVAGNHVEVVRTLLEHGADPNFVQGEGLTPLHSAADNGNVECIQLLLAHGAERRTRDRQGRTPYDLALAKNHIEAVKLLSNELTKKLRKTG